MDRLEQLLQQWTDGSLDDTEQAELVQLLESPENRKSLVKQLTLDQALVEHFQTDADTRLRIPAARHRNRRLAIAGALLAMAASIFIVVRGPWRSAGPGPTISSRSPLTTSPTTTPATWAKLVDLNGTLDLVNDAGAATSASVGQEILPGQRLQTGTNDSFAVVEFADNTRLELSNDTTIQFPIEQLAGKKLRLTSGSLRANVKTQPPDHPMIVSSQQMDMRVQGTQFLCVADADATRVDLVSGHVELMTSANATPIEMAAGYYAVMKTDQNPVIDVLPRQIVAPAQNLGLSNMRTVAFSPDGLTLFAATSRELNSWNSSFTRQNYRLLDKPVAGEGAVFSADCSTLAVGAKDGSIRIFDVPSRRQIQSLGSGPQQMRSLVLAPDGSWLAAVDALKPSTIRRWNCKSGEEQPAIQTEAKSILALAVSPDGIRLAAGAGYRRRAMHPVLLWQMPSGQPLSPLPGTTHPSSVVTFSTDGRLLASAENEGGITLWDLADQKLLRTIDGAQPHQSCLSFSPDNRLLAGGTTGGQVWIWEASTGAPPRVAGSRQTGVRRTIFPRW